MSKADVLAFAATMGLQQGDSVLLAQFYDEIVTDLARQAWVSDATILPVVAGTGLFAFPERAVRIMGVVYDDTELSESTVMELDAVDNEWRSRTGKPMTYVLEDETTRTVRLYPAPDVNSKDVSFPGGVNLGENYPQGSVVLFHTETREDVPEWLTLPIAFSILAREFERASAHRDPAFADACQKTADALMTLVV
jgi:hypothetical protein